MRSRNKERWGSCRVTYFFLPPLFPLVLLLDIQIIFIWGLVSGRKRDSFPSVSSLSLDNLHSFKRLLEHPTLGTSHSCWVLCGYPELQQGVRMYSFCSRILNRWGFISGKTWRAVCFPVCFVVTFAGGRDGHIAKSVGRKQSHQLSKCFCEFSSPNQSPHQSQVFQLCLWEVNRAQYINFWVHLRFSLHFHGMIPGLKISYACYRIPAEM